MARIVRPIQSSLPLLNSRRYIAVNDNLPRILNNELTYLAEYQPPLQPPPSFRSFSIVDRPGQQWIRLQSRNPIKKEEIKIDATMFDGVAPIPKAQKAIYEGEVRLHSSLVVEVSKDDSDDELLVFICSAWPESIEVQKVFTLGKRTDRVHPYMGRNFKGLNKKVQNSVLDYLEEREIDDDLAEFIHEYMANKGKLELLRWMKNVESYVQK